MDVILAFVEVPDDFNKVKVVITLEPQTIKSSHKLKDGRLEIDFGKTLTISEGQTLDIKIQQQNN